MKNIRSLFKPLAAGALALTASACAAYVEPAPYYAQPAYSGTIAVRPGYYYYGNEYYRVHPQGGRYWDHHHNRWNACHNRHC